MFAGLIKTTGTVRSLTAPGEDGMLSVETPLLGELDIFDAVSVNGACLTVTGVRSDCQGFYADVSGETLARTTLGNLKAGDRVNLERALRMGDAVGGHLLLGHVDGMGRIAEQTSAFGSFILGIDLPRDLAKYAVEKGSIAIDGVSLTVKALRGSRFFVSVMPLIAEETTLGLRRAGDMVNIETDIIGRYVESFLGRRGRIDRGASSAGGFPVKRNDHPHLSPHTRFCRG